MRTLPTYASVVVSRPYTPKDLATTDPILLQGWEAGKKNFLPYATLEQASAGTCMSAPNVQACMEEIFSQTCDKTSYRKTQKEF